MPTPKHLRQEAIKTVELWRRRLLLNEWNINIQFMDHPDANEDCLADISSDPVYLKANIRVYPVWAQRPKDTRTEALIHELCHCITQETRDLLNNSRQDEVVTRRQTTDSFERLTQRIANAVQWRTK